MPTSKFTTSCDHNRMNDAAILLEAVGAMRNIANAYAKSNHDDIDASYWGGLSDQVKRIAMVILEGCV